MNEVPTPQTTPKRDVLLVDDDDHFRETLADALSMRALPVHGVPTGQEALLAVRDFTPQLILLDMQLPDMRGLDLCRSFKASARLRDVPIVILSGAYTEPADRAEGLMAGADAYLSKPFNMESLLDEVQYLLDKDS